MIMTVTEYLLPNTAYNGHDLSLKWCTTAGKQKYNYECNTEESEHFTIHGNVR